MSDLRLPDEKIFDLVDLDKEREYKKDRSVLSCIDVYPLLDAQAKLTASSVAKEIKTSIETNWSDASGIQVKGREWELFWKSRFLKEGK